MANGIINGGFLKELQISHPEAGLKVFYGIKDEDSTYVLAGYTSDNIADGGGNIVRNMQPELSYVECTCSNDMAETLSAFEFLQICRNSLLPLTATFTGVNQITYSGSGVLDGQVMLSGNKSTMQFKIVSGGDGFVKQ